MTVQSTRPIELPQVEVNTFRKSNPLKGVVLTNETLFKDPNPDNDSRHIVFDTQGFNYLEGQSVGVLSPGLNEKDKAHAVRLYSISSLGNDVEHSEKLAVCVKRVVYTDSETGEEKRGVASNYLSDLKPGDEVSLTGPAGRKFLLPVAKNINRNYLFFATGTGIAPFRGMLQRLFHHTDNFSGMIYLFFGVKRESELMYDAEFQALQERPNFHYLKALSREQKNSEGGKMYLHHLIAQAKPEVKNVLEEPSTLIYMCGLKGMEEGIMGELASAIQMQPESEEFKQFLEGRGRVFTEVY